MVVGVILFEFAICFTVCVFVGGLAGYLRLCLLCLVLICLHTCWLLGVVYFWFFWDSLLCTCLGYCDDWCACLFCFVGFYGLALVPLLFGGAVGVLGTLCFDLLLYVIT